MNLIQLIAHVQGMRNYLKCVTAWSVYGMKAHRSEFSPYMNKKYKAMTVEYYILRMSEWKTTRPYNKKAR